jgi:hypothetical protein
MQKLMSQYSLPTLFAFGPLILFLIGVLKSSRVLGICPSDGDPWGLNPDLLVETEDNSIGEESRRSQSDYNRPEMLCLSN